MADAAGGTGFEIAHTVSRAFQTISLSPGLFLALTLCCVLLPELLVIAAIELVPRSWEEDPEISLYGLLLLIVVPAGAFVVHALMQGLLTIVMMRQLAGERPGLRDTLAAGLRIALPAGTAALLMWLALALIGSVALFSMGLLLSYLAPTLPGATAALAALAMLLLSAAPVIWLYIRWSVAMPALAAERPGLLACLRRSRRFTKGARLRIFVLLFVAGFASAIILGLTVFATRQIVYAVRPLALLIDGIVFAILIAVWAALQASAYVELREIREGVAPDDLETIFG